MIMFPGGAAKAAKEVGMAQVLFYAGEDWRSKACAYVASLPVGIEVTGEDVRVGCLALGIKPHHSNAWGGFINGRLKNGWFVKTGKHVLAKTVSSHARLVLVLRRI